mgnify:CR=1 FL=1
MAAGHGGRRTGKPGVAYGQRTDLNAGRPDPGPEPSPEGQYVGSRQGAIAPPAPSPGPLEPIAAPTQRPDEPLTEGVPFGPGRGPEVLGNPDAERLASMARYLPTLEFLTTLPDATVASRNLVRKLRAIVVNPPAPPPAP